jgi:hypothetical protein
LIVCAAHANLIRTMCARSSQAADQAGGQVSWRSHHHCATPFDQAAEDPSCSGGEILTKAEALTPSSTGGSLESIGIRRIFSVIYCGIIPPTPR